MTKKSDIYMKEQVKCALCGADVKYGALGLWDGYRSDLDRIGAALVMKDVVAVDKDSGRDVPLCPVCVLKEIQGMARYGLAMMAAEEEKDVNRFRCMECGRVFTLPKTRKTAKYCSESCKWKAINKRRAAGVAKGAKR